MQEIVDADASLYMLFDRGLDFGQGSLVASQHGNLPLHLSFESRASEAVVAALLAAHPGAAKERNRVRP